MNFNFPSNKFGHATMIYMGLQHADVRLKAVDSAAQNINSGFQNMPTVTNRPLFKAVFNAVVKAIDHGTAPTLMVMNGRRIVRASDKKYALVNNRLTFATLEVCLEVRDGSSNDNNANRFSGRAPDGSVHVGAVYFSMHNVPMFMELRHYHAQRSLVKALKGKLVLNLEITSPLLVLDLSMHSASTAKFLKSLEQLPEIKQAAGSRPLSLYDQMLAPNDFSVSRAIGLAAGRFPTFDGLIAPTARTDLDNRSGDNLILFGETGQRVSRKLKTLSAILFKLKKGPGELDFQNFEVVNKQVRPI